MRPATPSWRLLVAGVAALVAFFVTTGLVFSGITQSADASLALGINREYLGGTLNQLMVLATNYGRVDFWAGIVAIMLLLGKKQTRLLALELAVLLVVGVAVGDALKLALFRERPFETLAGVVQRLTSGTDSSYPSAHALTVAIGSAVVLTTFNKRIIAILLAFEAALVCYSRVYLGAHYPMDVLGGILIGMAIALMGRFALEKYLRPSLERAVKNIERVLRGGLLDL